MKNPLRIAHYFATLGWLAAASLIIQPLPAASGQDSGVTSAEKLKQGLTPPPAPAASGSTRGGTRGGLRGASTHPATNAVPAKRSGYVPAGGGGTRGSRALTEVDVSVVPANVSLRNIQFEIDSTAFVDEISRRQVEELAVALKDLAREGTKFLIEGHTCSKGKSAYNDDLSYDRAEKVRAELIAGGVPAASLRAIGCGEAEAARAGAGDMADESNLRPYRKVMVHVLAE